MKKEIGSDFNINLKLFFNKTKNNILKNSILLSSGNDCISYILKENKTKILLPSYLCKNILIPLKEENVKYSFYKINKKLQIDLEDLEYKIKKENPGMILIIHYFGFIQPNMDKIMNICTKNKIILIEDHVQSFLSKPKMKGDYLFNSYRKYLQIPDGAFLIKKTHTKIKIYNSPKKYVLKRFCAGILKNLIFLKKIWRKLFIDAEKKLIHNHK
ncbi:DegT/DnrJ/EryC1/StrS aminotransferase family protein, partial [Candidatus Woesearchaeota archaeon]|nr:DegT/DnrJ/EryC1/StrS aminotransferase family protein [Candidatus Woesearchaeota archaeon]